MPQERFYIDQLFELNQDVILEGSEFHHLAHVMRMDENDPLELVNGKGYLANATLISKDKKKAILHIDAVFSEEKPKRQIILAQALPRINRLDTIIEKATELGATSIWLFPGLLSERKTLTDHQIERLETLSIAAMKQCGRLYLPEIMIKPALKNWGKLTALSFFGDVSPKAPSLLSKVLEAKDRDLLIFIGPESGFNEEELKILHTLATGISLNANILRTDTAAIAAMTLLTLSL